MPKEEQVLNNVVITNVQKTGDGVNDRGGPWVRYMVQIDDPDWSSIKFIYFQSGKKIHPEVNMRVAELKFSEKPYKDWINYNINYIKLKEENKPKPKPKPQVQQNGNGKSGYDPIWMAVSYVKDLECERIRKSKEESITLKEHVIAIAQASKLLIHLIEEKEEVKQEKPEDFDPPPPDFEEPPFPIDDEENPL